MSAVSEITSPLLQPTKLEAVLTHLQPMTVSHFLSSFSKMIGVSFVIALTNCFSNMECIASEPEDLHFHKDVLIPRIHEAQVSVLNALLQL